MKGRARIWSGLLLVAVVVVLAGAASAAARSDPKTIALFELRHPHGLGKFVRSVSNPRSDRYRDYRLVGALVRRYGAKRPDRRAVRRWVRSRGGRSVVLVGRWVLASIPDRKLQAAARGRDPAYLVPPALRHRVRSLNPLPERPAGVRREPLGPRALPTRQLPPDHGSARERTGTPAGCPEGTSAPNSFAEGVFGFTPNQYLAAYGHAELQREGLRGAGQRVALLEVDGFARSDVQAFAECFGLDVPPIRSHLVGIDSQPPIAGETVLDLSMLAAAASGLDAIDVYTGRNPESGPRFARVFLRLLQASLDEPARRPTVISISLGACEASMSGARSTVRAVNDMFSIAAGAGISVVIAAGDTGSSGECTAGGPVGLLSPSFPASSPYATAVGGTNLVLDEGNRIVEEIIWNDGPLLPAAGGGGLSLLWNSPWWQRGISAKASGRTRALPDVAGLADGFPGYALNLGSLAAADLGKAWTVIGGTSAATPLYAGGIALANQAAGRRGQPDLGLLNPLINRLGTSRTGESGLRDVVSGSNDIGPYLRPEAGGGQPLGCCTAMRGYDLASGWGSIDFPAFSNAAIAAFRRGR